MLRLDPGRSLLPDDTDVTERRPWPCFRVTVASLLTVILMTNMEYLTTVLHQLLVRHISRIARSKHPHLMLRRTETVTEKLLTNWISVCLYG